LNLDSESLGQYASELGVSFAPDVIGRFGRYGELLAKWNRTYNLTAIRDDSKFVSHHLMDSLVVLPHLLEGSLVDVGSGGGLPGIPIAIANPSQEIVLLDASQKKGTFSSRLSNRTREHPGGRRRVENFRPARRFQNVISGRLRTLPNRKLAAHLRDDAGILAMKGLVPYEELGQLPPGWARNPPCPCMCPVWMRPGTSSSCVRSPGLTEMARPGSNKPKGGVGKTTTTINLAASLRARAGGCCLLI
jgi:16S rRNA (guanine527-N7)-methyltransferase